MGLMKEFKDFALKGNVMDLAVGVIIGAAFSAIVKSLVEDIITPLILTPVLKAANLENIKDLTWGAGVKYGNFLSNVISFLIVAFILFLIIKGVNAARKKDEAAPAAPPAPSNEEKLLMEIRDALKSRP
ncbi:large conductance mechanosensitive channel protein MscL [Flavobacterium sp. DG1-102-2]|uniref:large conductance mechanosensitive channel protein MscL n=1 Tax=Flavobacterium sp. DG1-102-2 TaxID=3081663 RepID=UPI00294A1526|nr:large conductance mechanosensitive channel protein MscL [Flavobacterium sp. DG1-102-2]MDV6169219.1 large conductance mechanosensitive channel protein MscL [Flavobacterium sp. DG1-102-2]